MPHRLHIRPARNYAQPSATRNRVRYAGLALAVVATGLLRRKRFRTATRIIRRKVHGRRPSWLGRSPEECEAASGRFLAAPDIRG